MPSLSKHYFILPCRYEIGLLSVGGEGHLLFYREVTSNQGPVRDCTTGSNQPDYIKSYYSHTNVTNLEQRLSVFNKVKQIKIR